MVGKWTLECPSGGIYVGQCEHSKEDGSFVLRCPSGVTKIKEGCSGVAEGEEELEAQAEKYKKIGYWEGYFETLKKLKERGSGEETEIEFSEPIRRERGKEVYVDVYHEKEECHPSSFRVIKPNPEHILTICCPAGQYDYATERCLASTMAQKLEHLHAEEEVHV